jgi:hypothetical protein
VRPSQYFSNCGKSPAVRHVVLAIETNAARLPPYLESASTVVPLAPQNILLLGELSRDSSECFSRRKFFQFKMENILLESPGG